MSRDEHKKTRQAIEKVRDHIANRRVEQAKEIVKDLIRGFQAEPDAEAARLYAELWHQLGICQLLSRKTEKAVRAFENALATDPAHAESALRLVECRLDSAEAMSHDMVPHYIRYVSDGPHEKARVGALRRLHEILRIRLSERPATVPWRVEMLRRLVTVSPALKFPRLYLGRGLYLQEDYEGTILELEPLIEKSPDSHHVLNMLGRCYEKLGRLEDAREAWDQSLRVSPGQAGVHFRLGRLELVEAQQKN